MPANNLKIDSERLLGRLKQLGQIGRTDSGGVTRLALTDEDKAGRDLVGGWMKAAGLTVQTDKIGNLFAVRAGAEAIPGVMSGSHIDTVIDGGRLDGAYGVLAALEVMETLNDAGVSTQRPLIMAVFTNEEGVRFQPDMMGSLAYVGGMSVDSVLATEDREGRCIGTELKRIGYEGDMDCGELKPHSFVELHIEQGPVLEQTGRVIGAVEYVQGISWTEIEITGTSNHAGTTPMELRRDAGYCAGEVSTYVRALARDMGRSHVATVGSLELKPNAINVVPGYAKLTVDMRNTDNKQLSDAESLLEAFLKELEVRERVKIYARRLVRFDPVDFDQRLVGVIEQQASKLELSSWRMISGAGHDAQMMSRVCAAAMIFVPSRGGISHNPDEHSEDDHLVAGANVLLHTMLSLSET